jgi:hypothetical protein
VERERFTWNAEKAHELVTTGVVSVPTIDDDNPAGNIAYAIDTLISHGAIGVPAGFRVSIIGDDDDDSSGGVIVGVQATGTSWPLASDGWSESGNYLPTIDEDDKGELPVLDEMVAMALGRADRCLAFLQEAQRAFEGPTVLCIRDPDWPNEYVADGPQREITIDIGGQWNDYKHFARELAAGEPEAVQYEAHIRDAVAHLAADNPVRQRAEEFFTTARKDG